MARWPSATQAAAGPGGLELRRWWRWTSGRERHAAQPAQCQEKALLPGPTGGQVQVPPAGRAGQPAWQVQVADPEGLGGDKPLAQPDPGDPAGQVVRDDVEGEPGGVGGELPAGQVVEADAVLEVADGVLHLGVAAGIGVHACSGICRMTWRTALVTLTVIEQVTSCLRQASMTLWAENPESARRVIGPPAPACHARHNAWAATWSSCRAEPQVNERRNVPSVDGAATRWPRTAPVAPARSRSTSSIHSPPANAEWTRVMALSPMLAAPGASPRSTWVSNSSRSRSPSARVAARIRPASATAWSSSKVTAIASGLWETCIEQVPS